MTSRHFSIPLLATVASLLLCCRVLAVQEPHQTLGDSPISVHPRTLRLVDEYFREVYFHGLNVVVKGFPWVPDTVNWSPLTSFTTKDMEVLQELGLNSIRLGTMWPGVEPLHGQYNQTYLDVLHGLVANASKYGIYSLLDMHQDVLSEKFCGEGVPLWAAIPDNNSQFPAPQRPPYNVSVDGIPSKEECLQDSWATYYFTKAAGSAFQNLYDNNFGLRDSWANFWVQVATRMSDLGSAVLGYELMNEPWAGDAVADLLLMVPGVADSVNLQPTWDVGAAAIRTVDTDHAIFFEAVTWDWLGVGFTDVPGGAAWRNKSVLSYHFYIPPDFSLEIQFAARQKDMSRLQCGGFLTEFYADASVMDKCDEESQSWMIWSYKPYIPGEAAFDGSGFLWFANGTMNIETARLWSRTYAKIVAGRTVTQRFHQSTGLYVLVFVADPLVTLNVTKVYLNEALHYPGGFNVSATTSAGPEYVTWNHTATNHIEITHNLEVIRGNETVSVVITSL